MFKNSILLTFSAILAMLTCSFTEVDSRDIVTDIDGNVYHTIRIGTQTWMVENLKTTRYRNGDLIGTTTPATKDISSESTPKYQWAYNGDEANAKKYGRLYTWYTVSDSRNIAPMGWHVPTDAEWTTLENYLNPYEGSSIINVIAKSLAATSDWTISTSISAIGNDLTKNNRSGMSCLPGGCRNNNGTFQLFGNIGYWWSSTEGSAKGAWDRYLFYEYSFVIRKYYDKQYGFSVRCVLDY